MKRILVSLCALVALVVLTVTTASASPYLKTIQLKRAKVVAGVYTPDSAAFILEGNSGSAPTCNDTTESFYIGDLAVQQTLAGTTNAVPLLRVAISGVPTGVATDTLRAFIDYSMNKTGPWATVGQAVPTGWDITLLQDAPTAASDSTGAGYSYANSTIASNSTRPVYSGVLALTSVTAGSSLASPVGWKYARLRLTGDKTTGLANSLLWASVWVSFPVDLAPQFSPGDGTVQ